MIRKLLSGCLLALAMSSAVNAHAVASAELYQNQTYTYGRFEARIRFAAGDGVISSFFLWKPGSEVAGTFWNELDFEKLGADCRLHPLVLEAEPLILERVSVEASGPGEPLSVRERPVSAHRPAPFRRRRAA